MLTEYAHMMHDHPSMDGHGRVDLPSMIVSRHVFTITSINNLLEPPHVYIGMMMPLAGF